MKDHAKKEGHDWSEKDLSEQDVRIIAAERFYRAEFRRYYSSLFVGMGGVLAGSFLYDVNHLAGALVMFGGLILLVAVLARYLKKRKSFINSFMREWNDQRHNPEA